MAAILNIRTRSVWEDLQKHIYRHHSSKLSLIAINTLLCLWNERTLANIPWQTNTSWTPGILMGSAHSARQDNWICHIATRAHCLAVAAFQVGPQNCLPISKGQNDKFPHWLALKKSRPRVTWAPAPLWANIDVLLSLRSMACHASLAQVEMLFTFSRCRGVCVVCDRRASLWCMLTTPVSWAFCGSARSWGDIILVLD